MGAEQARYTAELFECFRKDLGEMSEMQLFGYLKSRPLVGCTAEQVLAELEKKDQLTVHFDSDLPPGSYVEVRIRRVPSGQ